MLARRKSIVFVLALCGLVFVVPRVGYGQCEPPGPNTKCWDNDLGDGNWANDLNWNPDLVPVATDNVYHLIGGTITYDVTLAENQTIASYTAGGTATGLVVNAGLVLHLTGGVTILCGIVGQRHAVGRVLPAATEEEGGWNPPYPWHATINGHTP